MTDPDKRKRNQQVRAGLDRIDELLERIDQAADRLLAPRPPEAPRDR